MCPGYPTAPSLLLFAGCPNLAVVEMVDSENLATLLNSLVVSMSGATASTPPHAPAHTHCPAPSPFPRALW